MRVQFMKLLGLTTIPLEYHFWIIELGVGNKLTTQSGAEISIDELPVLRRNGSPSVALFLGPQLLLGPEDRYHDIGDTTYVLKLEFPNVQIAIDWENLFGADKYVQDDAHHRLMREVEKLRELEQQALTEFFEAYRRARYDSLSHIESKEIANALHVARRIPDFEYFIGHICRVSNDSQEYWLWLEEPMTFQSTGIFDRKFVQLVQSHLTEGQDFSIARLLDAEQALHSGDTVMAVINAALALERNATEFVYGKWLKRGISKKRLDDVKSNISLSQIINIGLRTVSPIGDEPSSELVRKLDELRRLRNQIVHEGYRDVSSTVARSHVDAVRELIDFTAAANSMRASEA